MEENDGSDVVYRWLAAIFWKPPSHLSSEYGEAGRDVQCNKKKKMGNVLFSQYYLFFKYLAFLNSPRCPVTATKIIFDSKLHNFKFVEGNDIWKGYFQGILSTVLSRARQFPNTSWLFKPAFTREYARGLRLARCCGQPNGWSPPRTDCCCCCFCYTEQHTILHKATHRITHMLLYKNQNDRWCWLFLCNKLAAAVAAATTERPATYRERGGGGEEWCCVCYFLCVTTVSWWFLRQIRQPHLYGHTETIVCLL